VQLLTKNDSVMFILRFMLGKKEEKGQDIACDIYLDELTKMATATESRRW
jgi:hypothetical protein